MVETGSPLPEGRETRPIVKPLLITAHRMGGMVHAPDNSLPNLEYGMTLGVTAVETDFQRTADGCLIVSHANDVLEEKKAGLAELVLTEAYLVDGGKPGKQLISEMTRDEVKRLRYRGLVGAQEQELWLPEADEIVEVAKGRTNFHIGPKGGPRMSAEPVLAFLARNKISDRTLIQCMNSVESKNLTFARELRAGDDRVSILYWDFQEYDDDQGRHRVIEEIASIGVEMYGTVSPTAETIAFCHDRGIAAMPSVGSVTTVDEITKYLLMGVDCLLVDDPQMALATVENVMGKEYLPVAGQTMYDVMQSRKRPRQ